jgi:hypothetical protein
LVCNGIGRSGRIVVLYPRWLAIRRRIVLCYLRLVRSDVVFDPRRLTVGLGWFGCLRSLCVIFGPRSKVAGRDVTFGPGRLFDVFLFLAIVFSVSTIAIIDVGGWTGTSFGRVVVIFSPRRLGTGAILRIVFGPGRRWSGVISIFEKLIDGTIALFQNLLTSALDLGVYTLFSAFQRFCWACFFQIFYSAISANSIYYIPSQTRPSEVQKTTQCIPFSSPHQQIE